MLDMKELTESGRKMRIMREQIKKAERTWEKYYQAKAILEEQKEHFRWALNRLTLEERENVKKAMNLYSLDADTFYDLGA